MPPVGLVDSALPEPLRQLGLPLPLWLYALLLSWLFLGSLLLRVAPLVAVSLRSETLARLFLIGLLSALPWLRSLLWLPLAWFAVTWVGALPADRSEGPAGASSASLPFLRRGLLADGLLCLACALFFWAQGGTWSRAGAGFVAEVPPATAAPDAGPPLPEPRLDLTAATVLAMSPGPAGAEPADLSRPSLHQRLGHKLFLGLPLSAVLLVLWLSALLLKLASGAALLRGLRLRQVLRAPSQSLAQGSLLPALAPLALAVHLWLCLRGLW